MKFLRIVKLSKKGEKKRFKCYWLGLLGSDLNHGVRHRITTAQYFSTENYQPPLVGNDVFMLPSYKEPIRKHEQIECASPRKAHPYLALIAASPTAFELQSDAGKLLIEADKIELRYRSRQVPGRTGLAEFVDFLYIHKDSHLRRSHHA